MRRGPRLWQITWYHCNLVGISLQLGRIYTPARSINARVAPRVGVFFRPTLYVLASEIYGKNSVASLLN